MTTAGINAELKLQLQEKLRALEERVKKLEDSLLTSSSRGDLISKKKKASAREFLRTKQLSTDTQRVLALGYFLEYLEGMDSFNANDLEAAFRSAKEKLPSNVNDAVNKNIARGFLMEAAEKKESRKAWCLTSTGEGFVENKLGK
jgi:hypothetical protein